MINPDQIPQKLTRVSYSSATSHRTCPQMWAYRTLDGIHSTKEAPARDFGSWWHLVVALEAFDLGQHIGSLLFAPQKLSAGPITLTLNDEGDRYLTEHGSVRTGRGVIYLAGIYWRTLDHETQEQWTDTLGATLPDRLTYMMAEWQDAWSDSYRNELPIAIEMPFTMGTDPGLSATGIIDLIYYDVARRVFVVRDYKTSKDLQASTTAQDLMNSQLHLYGLAAETWLGELPADALTHLGITGTPTLGAVSYDRARSVHPKAPQLTTTGTLSKAVNAYDRRTYREFCEGPDGNGALWGEPGEYVKTGKRAGEPKFGRYQADPKVIAHLDTLPERERWFSRTLTLFNRGAAESHLAALQHTQADQIRTFGFWQERGEAPRNYGRACSWCDYAELCKISMVGGARGEYPLDTYGLALKETKDLMMVDNPVHLGERGN